MRLGPDHKLSPQAKRKLANQLSDQYMDALKDYYRCSLEVAERSNYIAGLALEGMTYHGPGISDLCMRMDDACAILSSLRTTAHSFGIDIVEMAKLRAPLHLQLDDSLKSINAARKAIGTQPMTRAEHRQQVPRPSSMTAGTE
jgi:hypothetical protein